MAARHSATLACLLAIGTVALTVATRERMSVFQRLGGWRMALLLLLHPIRVMRMGLQAVLE